MTNLAKDENGDLVTDSLPQYFSSVEETFLSAIELYLGLMMLGRQKYTQQNY
jgi:hypothetical protein